MSSLVNTDLLIMFSIQKLKIIMVLLDKVQPPLGDVALLGINPLRIYVMLFEAAQHDVRGDCGGTSSWSIKGLASELHIKRETASRALNKLLDSGFWIYPNRWRGGKQGEFKEHNLANYLSNNVGRCETFNRNNGQTI